MKSTKNIEKNLPFSNTRITAKSVTNVENYMICSRTIVINIGKNIATIGQTPEKPLLPLHSSIYDSVIIKRADHVLMIKIEEENNLGGIVSETGWIHYWQFLKDTLGEEKAKDTGFDPTTPLWKSAQIQVGKICANPEFFSGNNSVTDKTSEYEIKVNLWYAPEKTDCSIHNSHDFIEIHAQILGIGRMQKFKKNDKETLYEDTIMGTGYTTPIPFCSIEDNGQFLYPWHQYYSDTDCIWLAIEFHKVQP